MSERLEGNYVVRNELDNLLDFDIRIEMSGGVLVFCIVEADFTLNSFDLGSGKSIRC